MKVLAVVFSARKEGNCSKLATYCLDRFREYGSEVEIIKASQLDIRSCNHCDYECFANKECPIKDDIPDIYKKCENADIVIFAIPTYGAHLSSMYFAFAERSQAIFKSFDHYTKSFLKKVNFIIVGNLSAGGDMALHEALYNFANLGFWPEVLLFPSREYGKNSIKGDLIEVPEVKKRLDEFVKMLVKNAERRRSTSVKSK